MPDQFDAFNPQNASENNAERIRHLSVNLKNVRVLAPPMLFGIEIWRQWQPLIFPPIQASNGALRSIKHERRNVVIRVRDCKMTKNSGIALRDANTTRRALSDLIVVQ